jgi:hypothetical protein
VTESDPPRLPWDQQVVLGSWACDAVADDLGISYDDAKDLLAAAHEQGRVQMLGNSRIAGVAVDGRWVVVEGRYQLQQAALEWATLRMLDRQFDDDQSNT